MNYKYLKTWDELLMYQSSDLITNKYIKYHGGEPNVKKVKQIRSAFIQAAGYFKNYELADFTVKPLLLYYGVQSLTRGLILFLNKSAYENTLKSSHGLTVKNWEEALNDYELDQLKIIINAGTFYQLIESTNNESKFRHNSNGVNYSFPYPILDKESVLSFGELLYTFTDLANEYEALFNRELVHLKLDNLRSHPDNKINLSFSGKNVKENIDILFKEEEYKEKNIGISSSNADGNMYYHEDSPLINLSQKWGGAFELGDIEIVKKFDNDFYINELGKFYIASYVLGMLCRYYPSNWIAIQEGAKGDKYYPYFVTLIRLIKNYYPVMVLDFLKQPNNSNA